MRRRSIKVRRRPMLAGLLVAIVIAALASQLVGGGGGASEPSSRSGVDLLPGAGTQASAEATLQRAFDTHREGFWIEASGQIVRVLADDREGSRHQRVIVTLDTGQTLLIAHNIDVAPRVERIEVGDRLRFRGEYVWNAQGGVIHWTHHDPDGTELGGWLEHQGRRYR
ncbi:DUF3465 domain-containing protein [Salinicola sp. LHM]|uniref:DUF3465 domain-containing protein n=1 Tax=Salinicola TaxID=404432 RepID=UPI0023E44A2E|nr:MULTISPECIES: DUF3465 domain-containing protein [Salinicola]MDF3919706.1 DUF3465 domain-containing protein [Salinicola salarius]MEC8917282.1 DUF3465 domain-containing protein [Pseudomonadota bacterium]MED5500187.1 DUF3465 domain-containing protein [Pseudomonadota bacterium]WQH32043.1 DUF3465 domain-containing protein [Salinicola sp. LHM]